MTHTLLKLLASALILSCSACSSGYPVRVDNVITGSGQPIEQVRLVGRALALEVVNDAMIDLQLTVSVGLEPALLVSADSNLLPMIHSEMSGSTLKIRVDDNVRSSHKIKILYSTNQLERLAVRRSGTVTVNGLDGGALTVDNAGSANVALSGKLDQLKLASNGSGRFDARALTSKNATVRMDGTGQVDAGRLAGSTLQVDVNGSGKFTASGIVRKLDATINGSGQIDLASLVSETATLSSNGAGSIMAKVQHEVQPRTTGSGSIRIQGAPTVARSSGSRITYVP